MSYTDGYQDGYQGQPQRQQRRPYATGYKNGRSAYEAETNKREEETLNEWKADVESE